jgi:hypothetical protein
MLKHTFQFCWLYFWICVMWGNYICIGRERVKLSHNTIDFLETKWRWHLIKMTVFDSNVFDLYWTCRVRRQLAIMHKLRPPAHVHLLYFNITCQRDLLKCHVTYITFSVRRLVLKAIIKSDISVSFHLRAPEMEVWHAARPCHDPSFKPLETFNLHFKLCSTLINLLAEDAKGLFVIKINIFSQVNPGSEPLYSYFGVSLSSYITNFEIRLLFVSTMFRFSTKILYLDAPVYDVGLRSLACRDCGFESLQGHVCLLWLLCVVW